MLRRREEVGWSSKSEGCSLVLCQVIALLHSVLSWCDCDELLNNT